MSVQNQTKTYLKNYQAPHFQLSAVALCVELGAEHTQVSARLSLKRAPGPAAEKAPLILQGEQLQLLSIQLGDRLLSPSEYRLDSQTLCIPEVPDQFELSILTRLNPQANTALSGLYCSNQLFCTQCEAEGFRRITYSLDRPDSMSVYTTKIIADKKTTPVLLANGNLIEKGDVPGSKTLHYAIWHDPFPKPSYLFALVAGQLVAIEDYYLSKSNRLITLKIYVETQNQDSCAHAMSALKRAMQWDEERYGREYDLDVYMIVAVNDFNMGAMENKGLNIFNAKYILARPEFATDTDFNLIDAVVAHEYFHNWSGNRVTCRDWFQLSLKEGLTVFREQQFSETFASAAAERIEQVQLIRSRQFQEDASPMAHPVRPAAYLEINNFYTVTVYEKGAELIRMLSTLLGPERFRLGMDRYFADNDGKAATVEDFLAAMQSATELDLSAFMRWYTQAGTPKVIVSETYDPSKQSYTLHLIQQAPDIANGGVPLGAHWAPLMIPLRLTLFHPQTGQPYPESIVLLTEAQQDVVFHQIPEKPIASLFQYFSAPVKVERSVSDAALRFLSQHDTDPVNRWDALQQLIKQQIRDWVGRCQRNQELPQHNELSDLFKTLLESEAAPLSTKALLLQAPSFNELMALFKPIPLEALEKAYRHWIKTMGQDLLDSWQQVYQSWTATLAGPYVFSPDRVAMRALKNLALWYLGQTEMPLNLDRCFAQYQHSRHMTDRLAAMRSVMHLSDDMPAMRDKRAALFADYADCWGFHPLAMNKWFAVQAGSLRSDTLAQIRILSQHPQFSWSNPNNVYALFATFVMQNPCRFHAADGQGYRFIESAILRLDKENPQVAARLMQGWMDWRQFDAKRQALMRDALDRLLQQSGLSKDVFELAEKYRQAD